MMSDAEGKAQAVAPDTRCEVPSRFTQQADVCSALPVANSDALARLEAENDMLRQLLAAIVESAGHPTPGGRDGQQYVAPVPTDLLERAAAAGAHETTGHGADITASLNRDELRHLLAQLL
ncbi:hypothetical protein [Rhodovibrio salinarum]|uniref:Uncharacterized protein n=1 Tax=Rhodovibrio salinarum TaxID=1087 RepID=A0A934UYT2_9PROT|nr:hypothetical protein [Rhodovibrio salinarum]MBK1695741.1 hypothetical protein [Rhodovibrio salinarum]